MASSAIQLHMWHDAYQKKHRPLTWSQLKCQLPRVWWDCAHGRWPGLLKNMLTCADCLWWHQITCDIMWSHARDGDMARVHRPQVLRWWSQQNGCVWKWDTSHPPRGLSIFYIILLYDKLINKRIFELVPHFFDHLISSIILGWFYIVL